MLKTILTGAQYLSAVNGEADPRITHVVVSGFLKTFFHKSMRKCQTQSPALELELTIFHSQVACHNHQTTIHCCLV